MKKFSIAGIILTLFVTQGALGQITYYSRADGNWTTPTTWSTISCVGAAAASVPGTNDNVVICAGRTVTFDGVATTTVANLSVELTAVLTLSVNFNLRVNSFVLDGTVNGGGGGDIRMGRLANSTLSGIGSFSTTTNATQLRILTSVSILPGTDIRFTGNGRLNLNGQTATNNGKISIINPSTIVGDGTFVNNAATAYLLFTRLADWPGTTALIATAPGNTVEYGANSGTRLLDLQGSYYHLIISGGGTKVLNTATTTIAGNLTISNGSTLDTNVGNRNLLIGGNWINNLGGIFIENTSLVVFNGSTSNQSLVAPVAGETFYDLTINNTFASGGVTSSGDVTITAGRTLTMTSGVFDMGTNTLSGAANLSATGGDLRLGKLNPTILPELTGAYNLTGGTITFNGSANQTINEVPIYHNIALSGAGTKTLNGNITVRGNWTNTGAMRDGNFAVIFAGGAPQTITNTAGEVFYRVEVNTTGPLIFDATTNVTITNRLTMTSGNVDLNGRTLTLGNGSGARLVHTSGICFGGEFRRFFPAATIVSTGNPSYGLFPVGTSIYYRPIEINSTVNPVTPGYVSVVHTDATTATDVSYNDNEGDAIERITNMNSAVSSATLAGGTYTLSVSMTTLSSAGDLADLKMETIAGPPYGVGTTVPTIGTVTSPTVIRSGLSVLQLNNTFVIGTKDKSTTPVVSTYYSRKTGNWNDGTVGDATWSLTDGGPSCGCIPITSSIVYVNPSHTVTITAVATTDFITVKNGATLTGSSNLTVNYNLTTEGTGRIAPTAGSWIITGNLVIAGTSASSSLASMTIGGDLEVDAGNTLTLNNPTTTVVRNVLVDGTLALGANAMTLSGPGATISGSAGAASITGSGTITLNQAKTILSSSNLAIQPVLNLLANTTVTNLGTVTLTGNLTGANATTSIWTNGSNSVLNTTGSVLATGTLNASASPNTINYNGSGAQTVKSPATSYFNLTISNAGTKSLAAAVGVTNLLTIQDAAILNAATFTLNGAGGLLMTGTSELRIGETANGTYPRLTGTYTLTSGSVTFNQTTGNYDIREVNYYNLNLSGGGGSNYDFNNGAAIGNDLTVTLANTAKIRNIDGAGPLTIVNNFVFNSTSSADSQLDKNITVGTFTFTAGAISAAAITIDVTNAGGWIRNGGTFTTVAGTIVLFSGTVDQQIGGTVATTFTNLELNNAGPTGVTLNQDITVSGTLTFTEGNLVTSGTNILTMAAGSIVTDVSDDSFVNGPMLKTGDTDFTFPVGKDGVYRPIAISTLTGGAGIFQAEYFHSNPTLASYDVTLREVTLTRVNNGEYWILDRTSGTTSAFVTLSWNAYSGIVDELPTLRIARWNGSLWSDLSNGGTTGSISPGTGTITTAATVSSFSPFTLAGSNDNNPLPIVLLDFQARLVDHDVLINWTTASELNNDYFTVEKTQDAKIFEEVLRVNGSGTTNVTHHYSEIDYTPFYGISYYRLKQTDYDGMVSYSRLVVVDNRGGVENPTVNIFPNPTHGAAAQLSVRGLSGHENVRVELWDINGKLIDYRQGVTDYYGQLVLSFETNLLAPGFYLVTVNYHSGSQKFKLVIN